MIRTVPSLVSMVDQLTRCTPQALRPPHPAVLPPGRTPRGGVEAVAPVDDQPPGGERSCVRGRKLTTVLVPFGDDDHGISPGKSGISVEFVAQVRVHAARIFKCLWISHHHLRAQPMQSHGDIERGRSRMSSECGLNEAPSTAMRASTMAAGR